MCSFKSSSQIQTPSILHAMCWNTQYLVSSGVVAFADYYVLDPSEEYAPLWQNVRKKTHISNVVIEYLQNNPDASYEDLLHRLQTVVPPKEMSSLSEEDLLRHAQFVVDQVRPENFSINIHFTRVVSTSNIT